MANTRVQATAEGMPAKIKMEMAFHRVHMLAETVVDLVEGDLSHGEDFGSETCKRYYLSNTTVNRLIFMATETADHAAMLQDLLVDTAEGAQ